MSPRQNIWSDPNLIEVLKKGGVAVMPTDTIYGIVGSALNVSTVNRIYDLRKRNPEKPCIVLIGDMNEFQKFGIVPTLEQRKEIEKYESFDSAQDLRPTSFILDCDNEEFEYLHRGTKTLAFRMPSACAGRAQVDLQNLLRETGPLLAPSANTEGQPPARNIAEAKKYFGGAVNLYVDGGEIEGKASKVIKLHKDGSVSILRE